MLRTKRNSGPSRQGNQRVDWIVTLALLDGRRCYEPFGLAGDGRTVTLALLSRGRVTIRPSSPTSRIWRGAARPWPAGVSLLGEPGRGGLGVKAVVAAPGAVMGGLVVVEGVRPTVAAARAAERAGPAAAGKGRRGPAGPVTSPAGVLFAGAAAGVLLLRALVGLLAGALAGAVGGLLAGIRAEAALAARVIGLAEAGTAGWAGAIDDAYVHRSSPRGLVLADRQAGSAPADAVGQPGSTWTASWADIGRGFHPTSPPSGGRALLATPPS